MLHAQAVILMSICDVANETVNDPQNDNFYIDIRTKGLKIGHLNICSLLGKFDDLKEKLAKKPFDILTISETHLDNTIKDGELLLNGFTLVRKDRNRHGGGVAVYISNFFTFRRRFDLEDSNLEALYG